jgi:hypothetical protein
MTKRLQLRSNEHAKPMWLRILALSCVLLVGVASSVQAVHIHGQWLPESAAKAAAPADASQLPGGEEHCPLCIAMHSALPVSASMQPVRMVLIEFRLVQFVDHAPDAAWHFALFSRPPPPVETL